MNYTLLKITVVGLCFLIPAVSSAVVTVDNVSLKKQGEFTELTIYASDAVEFDHKIVEPVAGKPYRVVIDLKDAYHKLPRYNFKSLPSETITSIRTSQFSVNPEKVVRIVLDVKGRVTYKVKRDRDYVTLVIATPDDTEFPFWCAQPLSEAEKIQLALGTAPESDQTKPVPEKAETVFEPVVTEGDGEAIEKPVLVSTAVSGESDDGPKFPLEAQESKPKFCQLPVQTESEEPVANPGVGTSGKTQGVESVPQPGIATEIKGDVSVKELTDSAAKPEPASPADDPGTDSGPADSKPKAPGSVPPGRKATQEEADEYRKNPDRPTKATGTLAERFPKRKVIEYQSWGKRDPFAQLVDKSRAGYIPGEIPNVGTLRLVGVLKAPEGSSALLEDYEGYGYILKDGDQVKNGYVVQIGQDKIIFQIKEYGWSRTIALRLETE
jgi:Tfp pilus assembly protein PilP